MKELKKKCKCGHRKEVHAPLSLQGIIIEGSDEYDGECCVQYRKDGKIKCCPCLKFEEAQKNT